MTGFDWRATSVLGLALLALACSDDKPGSPARDGSVSRGDAGGTDGTSTSGKSLSFVKLELDRAHAGQHAQIARSGSQLGVAYIRKVTEAVRAANPSKYRVTCPRGGDPANPTASDVYYVHHDGTDWGDPREAAARIIGPPSGLSLALDGSGNPHIGHLGGELGYFVCLSSDAMVTSSGDRGQSFTSQLIFGGGAYGGGRADTAGHWMAVGFDCNGDRHSTFRDLGTGGFESELVESAMWIYDAGEPISSRETPNGPAGYGEGEYNRLLYNERCEPVILSYDSNPGLLKIAVKQGATWSVSDAVRTKTSEQPGFASDGKGLYALAYYVPGDQSLRYRESRDLKDWGSEAIVDPSPSWHGTYASLAFDSRGNPGVSYYRCAKNDGAADCDPTEDALMFAYRQGGTWKTYEVDTGNEWFCGRSTSLVFTADDRPFIAYECTYRDNINDAFPSVLKVAEGEWK